MDKQGYCGVGDEARSTYQTNTPFEPTSNKSIRDNILTKKKSNRNNADRAKSHKPEKINSNSSFSDGNYDSDSFSPCKIDQDNYETYQNDNSSNESNKDNSKILNEKNLSIIPPPYPLLPKSLLPVEPVRSGAPIQFLKLTYAKAGSNILCEKQNIIDKSEEIKELEQLVYTKGKRPLSSMFTQDLKTQDINPIVYSRYATSEYNPNEKVPEDPWGSCIINIK